eukprot:6858586-Pyramimonas_sp.AAC.1
MLAGYGCPARRKTARGLRSHIQNAARRRYKGEHAAVNCDSQCGDAVTASFESNHCVALAWSYDETNSTVNVSMRIGTPRKISAMPIYFILFRRRSSESPAGRRYQDDVCPWW